MLTAVKVISVISIQPGHTSLQACLISWLSSGWLFSNSTGLPAKHTITALTELLIIPNKTLERARPTTVPILLFEIEIMKRERHSLSKAWTRK